MRPYRRGAAGDPTVLVHGSFSDHRYWDRVVALLEGELEILTYDRRGYSEELAIETGSSLGSDVADLAALLEAEQLFPAHVIGEDFGGAVGLALATERPELVRSVVVHEPPYYGLLKEEARAKGPSPPAGPGRGPARERVVAADGREAYQDWCARVGADERARPLPPEQIARWSRSWRREHEDPRGAEPAPPQELGGLLVPVLVGVGERSPPEAHRIAEALVARLPNGQCQVVPSAAHDPALTDPERYAAMLARFLLERNVPVS